MNFKTIFSKYWRVSSQVVAFAGCTYGLQALVIDRRSLDKNLMYKCMRIEDGRLSLCGDPLRQLLIKAGTAMGIPEDRLGSLVLYHNKGNLPIINGFFNHRSIIFDLYLQSIPSIGLPMNFAFQYFDESKFTNINIDGKLLPIESDSLEGVEFRRQLMMTENAKLFILGRQLYYLNSNLIAVSSTVKILSAFFLFQILFFVSKFLTSTKPVLRYLYYGCIGIVCYFTQRELFANYSNHIELEADQALLRLGPRFYNGGIEFYSKMIKMNKMLYAMGFTRKYTALGNESYGWLWNRRNSSYHARINKMLHPSRKPRDSVTK